MSFDDPQSALAAIIVFDQFSSNMFRGTPKAFATDSLALFIARHALEREYDAALPEQWRYFFYMPFMHSETAADQEHCVALFAALPGRHREIRHRASRHHRPLRPLPASQPGAGARDDRSASRRFCPSTRVLASEPGSPS